MFELVSKYKPSGDQPEAIKELVEGIKENKNIKFYSELPVLVKLLRLRMS